MSGNGASTGSKLEALLGKLTLFAGNEGAGQPTPVTFRELDQAWWHFNRELFGGLLQPVIIALSRTNASPGWYTHDRFVNDQGVRVGEITLNPTWFSVRSLRANLAELVHQMVHQLQHQAGRPGRGRYHNHEFAQICEDIGLACTDDSTPTGKRTGEGVTFILLTDGRFEVSARALETDAFCLTWLDRFPFIGAGERHMRRMSRNVWQSAHSGAGRGMDSVPPPAEASPCASSSHERPDRANEDSSLTNRFHASANGDALFLDDLCFDEEQQSPSDHAPLMDRSPGIRQSMQTRESRAKRHSRTKYSCTGVCGGNFWGRRGIEVTCIKDGGRFVVSIASASEADAQIRSTLESCHGELGCGDRVALLAG